MEKKCRICGETLDIEQFPRNKGMKDGRLNQCRICHKKLSQKYRIKVKRNGVRHYISMNGITKSDWCKMFDFMKKIGLDPSADIHEQFCRKHGLPPKKKPPKYIRPYLYTDCMKK